MANRDALTCGARFACAPLVYVKCFRSGHHDATRNTGRSGRRIVIGAIIDDPSFPMRVIDNNVLLLYHVHLFASPPGTSLLIQLLDECSIALFYNGHSVAKVVCAGKTSTTTKIYVVETVGIQYLDP